MIPEILFIGGLGLAAWGAYALVRAYKERKLQMDYCRDVDARLRAKQRELDDAEALISKYQQLCNCGNRLKFEIVNFNSDGGLKMPGEFFIAAFGERTRSILFCVKSFYYDPSDPEDRDFARREAEELLEKLQGK